MPLSPSPPFSAGDATFLFICLPGLSLVVSAVFRWLCSISIHLSPRSIRWPCSISTHLSPRSVAAGVRCHWWCPPFSCWPCSISIHLSPRSVTAGVRPFPLAHVALLCICLPGLSLLVSAHFRWPCSMSIHFSPRSVTAGVCPFPLPM